MFLLVPAYPGCPGSKAVKRSLLLAVRFSFFIAAVVVGWLGSRVVSVLDSGAVGMGSNRSRDAVG